MTKNILFLYTSNPNPLYGGIERVMSILMPEFEKTGRYRCYYLYTKEHKNDICAPNIIRMPEWDDPVGFVSGLIREKEIHIVANQMYSASSNQLLLEAVKGTRCGVINVFHASPAYVFLKGVVTARLTEHSDPVKVIVKELVYPFYFRYYARKINKIFFPKYLQCDRYVLLSNRFKTDFLRVCGLKTDCDGKIAAIPNPLSFSEFAAPEMIRNKKREVLIVSRFDPGKRIPLALKIWSIIEPQFDDWKLIVVGSGPDENRCRKLVRRFGLRHVSFEGRRDPLEYYRRASLFLTTSAFEGWSMTLTEAQQTGTVPLAFDSFASVRDIIENGRTGFIIPEKDIETYVARMKELMRDRVKREAMALEAVESSKRFVPDRIVQLWDRLFQEVVDEKRANYVP